jgi:hypothetical protein
MKKDINNPQDAVYRIDEALNSLDGVQRASAPDFFYSRLKARLEKKLPNTYNSKWVLRPVYIFSTLLLVIAINAFVFLRNQKITSATADNNESVQQSIAAEYNLYDINSVYDLNQDK